jgi:hypothetical protein
MKLRNDKEIHALLNKNQPVKNTTGSVKINCKIPEIFCEKGNLKNIPPIDKIKMGSVKAAEIQNFFFRFL